MKKSKRLLLIICLFSLLLTGCRQGGRTGEKKDQIKIGISVYNQYDTFIAEVIKSINKAAEEMEDRYGVTITLDIQNAGGNQISQNEQMDYFLDRDCDIVCINLVDRTDASTIIERGKSAQVPIIFFNRELVEEDLERWDQLYYVGADAFESGILQGEILVEKLETDFDAIDKNGDGVIQYVLLEGEAGHQDSIVRTMYAVNTVTKAGYKMEKLADEIANWNRDQGKTKMLQWIQEYGETIEVVFANNDDMALGALDAVKEMGYGKNREDWFPAILGIDGIQEAIEAVDNGEFLGTVINDAKGQGEATLELAYALISGQSLDTLTYPPEKRKYIRRPYKKYIKQVLD